MSLTNNLSDEERKKYFFSHYSKKTLEDFKKFHKENPHIYEEFKKLAYRMKGTGRKKYSSKMIINVLRWESDLGSTGDEFKINDKFQSIYGRLLAYQDSTFEDFFEFRIRENK
jgi:hypothetical protein